MKALSVLVIGAGIGGLTAAIALRQHGFRVQIIEKDPVWSVYGVGIIQQGNVLRALDALGILDQYVDAGVGFDAVEVFAPNGTRVARVPSHRLLAERPANLGISRRALQKVLGDAAIGAGATLRLGVTAAAIEDAPFAPVNVHFSDHSSGNYDLVIGADGAYSQTRSIILPEVPKPEFTGQAVWRYNLPRLPGLDALHAYNGAIGAGLVPISRELMYMYLTTPEPENPHYPREGLAARMRSKTASCAPAIRDLARAITDDDGVVYRPLEKLLVEGHGTTGVWCCWAMRCTQPPHTWDKEPGSPSKTAWYWLRSCRTIRASSPRSRLIARVASTAAPTSCARVSLSAGDSSAKARLSITQRRRRKCST